MNWKHEAVARDLTKRARKFINKGKQNELVFSINMCQFYLIFSEDKKSIVYGSGETEFTLQTTISDKELYNNFLSVLEKFESRNYKIEYFV